MNCPNCGNLIDDGVKVCPICGKQVGAGAEMEKPIAPGQQIPVSSNKRLINLILDSIFYVIICGIYGGILGLSGASDSFIETAGGTFSVYLIMILYYVISETLWGRTPAKFITGCKVIKKDGTPLGFGTVLGRTICRFIPFEIFSFLGQNPVGWHDSIPKTIVVENK